MAKFGVAFNNPAISGLAADPNQNGLSNLLEYALGLDPMARGSTGTVRPGVLTIGDDQFLSLSFTRPAGLNEATDVTYSPRRSITLGSTWSTDGIVLVGVTPGPGALETVTVRSALPMQENPKEFLQLEVTLD